MVRSKFLSLYIFFSTLLLLYVLLPAPHFPQPLPGSRVSSEPADLESLLRRGYYTDAEREDVIAHYMSEFTKSQFLSIPLPTLRLNYPPEESQTIIRDQTRSTYLEELAHPLRESLYISGFEPKERKDDIFIDGKYWKQKVIVKYVPSFVLVRVLVTFLIVVFLWMIVFSWKNVLEKK